MMTEGFDLAGIDYQGLPERLRSGMRHYIEEHEPVGSFLTSVLENDLRLACCQADPEMLPQLRAIAVWLYCEAPPSCYGSRELVRGWLDKGATMTATATEGATATEEER